MHHSAVAFFFFQKTQTIADQAWEQVRATGSIQMGLEAEVVELRKDLAESQVFSLFKKS